MPNHETTSDHSPAGQSEQGPSSAALPRAAERVILTADVDLRRAGQHNYRVRVFDASPNGCKVEFVERPDLEERVWIRFDGLQAIEALVCWIEGPAVGLQFVRPMYQAVFDALMARMGSTLS